MVKKCYWKNKKMFFLVILIIILILAFGIFYFKDNIFKNNNNMDLDFKNVCINNDCFKVEVLTTQEQRREGLMFREYLPEKQGMLFVFDAEDFYSFWMKNMNFSLDIIWINKDKKIVHIEENVQPCRGDVCQGVRPEEKAMYVLEINSGLTDKMGIKIGDKVSFGI